MTPKTENTKELWVVADRIRFCGGLPGHDLELLEAEIPPGSGTPPHSHASPEMFYIVSGSLTVSLFTEAGEPPQVTKAGPGDTICVAPNVPHNYVNDSGAMAKVIVLLEPSMTAFFRDVGTDEPQTAPDFAKMGAAMERHGIEILAAAA